MTVDVLRALRRGRIVYTNYWIKWDGIDERRIWWKRILYSLLLKGSLEYIPASNLREFTGMQDLDRLQDALVALDEGWLYFDSYAGTKGFSFETRRKLMQSRKDGLDFYFTTQRPVAMQAGLRAITNIFVKCRSHSFFGLRWFIAAVFEDLDSSSLPRDTDEPVWVDRYFASKKIFESYDTNEKIDTIKQDVLRQHLKATESDKAQGATQLRRALPIRQPLGTRLSTYKINDINNGRSDQKRLQVSA